MKNRRMQYGELSKVREVTALLLLTVIALTSGTCVELGFAHHGAGGFAAVGGISLFLYLAFPLSSEVFGFVSHSRWWGIALYLVWGVVITTVGGLMLSPLINSQKALLYLLWTTIFSGIGFWWASSGKLINKAPAPVEDPWQLGASESE